MQNTPTQPSDGLSRSGDTRTPGTPVPPLSGAAGPQEAASLKRGTTPTPPAPGLSHRELAHLAATAIQHARTCDCDQHPDRHPEHGHSDTAIGVLHHLAVIDLNDSEWETPTPSTTGSNL